MRAQSRKSSARRVRDDGVTATRNARADCLARAMPGILEQFHEKCETVSVRNCVRTNDSQQRAVNFPFSSRAGNRLSLGAQRPVAGTRISSPSAPLAVAGRRARHGRLPSPRRTVSWHGLPPEAGRHLARMAGMDAVVGGRCGEQHRRIGDTFLDMLVGRIGRKPFRVFRQ